jgi:hypothetical protein
MNNLHFRASFFEIVILGLRSVTGFGRIPHVSGPDLLFWPYRLMMQ